MKSKNDFERNQPKYLAFVHHKGGTGKTTSCLNIAGWLAKMNQKVLVVDFDPQANATSGLGVHLKSVTGTMFEILSNQQSIDEVILETSSGIYLLPASIDLLLTDLHLASEETPGTLLRKKLAALNSFFDFILFDVSPGCFHLMANAVSLAQEVIVPLDSGVFAYETLNMLLTSLSTMESELRIKINFRMALLKMFSHSIFDINYTRMIKKEVQSYLLAQGIKNCTVATIPFSKKICQAQCCGIPISHFAPYSMIARKYKQIAKSILLEKYYG